MANSQTKSRSFELCCRCSRKRYAHLEKILWSDITDLHLLEALFALSSQEREVSNRAEEVLQAAGSLSLLIQMPTDELRDLIPESPDAVALINLIRLSIHRIVNKRTGSQIRIKSPDAMTEYVAAHRNPGVGGDRRVVFLDRDSRLIYDMLMKMSESDIITCRKITQQALDISASGFIIIDYSYDDDMYFSKKSNRLHDKLYDLMSNIDIHMCDYLIVGINRYYSRQFKKTVKLYKY